MLTCDELMIIKINWEYLRPLFLYTSYSVCLAVIAHEMISAIQVIPMTANIFITTLIRSLRCFTLSFSLVVSIEFAFHKPKNIFQAKMMKNKQVAICKRRYSRLGTVAAVKDSTIMKLLS